MAAVSTKELHEPLLAGASPTSEAKTVAQSVKAKLEAIGFTFVTSDTLRNTPNPLDGLINIVEVRKKPNCYVTQNWSANFFTATAKDTDLLKNAIVRSLKAAFLITLVDKLLKSENPQEFAMAFVEGLGAIPVALLDTAILLLMLGINIELANFVKGVSGILFTVVHLLAAIPTTLLESDKTARQKAWTVVEHFVKAIATILACAGHAIPSWIGVVPGLHFLFAPAVISALTKSAGASDAVGYSLTCLLLWLEIKSASNEDEIAEKKLALHDLREEIKPWNGAKGVIFTTLMLHIFMESVITGIPLLLQAVSGIHGLEVLAQWSHSVTQAFGSAGQAIIDVLQKVKIHLPASFSDMSWTVPGAYMILGLLLHSLAAIKKIATPLFWSCTEVTDASRSSARSSYTDSDSDDDTGAGAFAAAANFA